MCFLYLTDSEISMGLKGCSCGKNITRGDKASCLPSAKCPCVKKECDAAESASAKTVVIMISPKLPTI